MNVLRWITHLSLLSTLLYPSVFGQGDTGSAALNTLVETERAFAAMSEKEGIKKAFLTYLDDEGVIFQPGPVKGKLVWRSREETTARLSWHPTLAWVSESGDLGCTSGPWVYTPEAHLDQPPRYGHFVSVWRKQSDGSWKVVADIGVKHDYVHFHDSLVVVPSPPSPKKRRSTAQERKLLLAAEQGLSALSSSEGIAAALPKVLAEDARVYRDGLLPLVGRQHVIDHMRKANVKMFSRVTFAATSRACDLAYTYGNFSTRKSGIEDGYFLRIWRKDSRNEWKLVVDVASPASK